jgi:hypothetical protein
VGILISPKVLPATNSSETPAGRGLRFPPFAKKREGWGTHFLGDSRENNPLDFVLLLQFRDYAEIFECRGIAFYAAVGG